ncbi:MAG: ECF-type sigma factor [Luteolibacter sp.]|uniref:ECF-type sigma factor n=1 Tax=Luteolibacter sp. TaxID=1962973 RepID=UPI0032646CFB
MADFDQLLTEATRNGRIPSRELLPLVYDELRSLASKRMAMESGAMTLQPTALVHEVWLRLSASSDQTWEDKDHFFKTAATAMRRILVDRARTKATLKRGNNQRVLSIDDVDVCAGDLDDRLLMIDDVLRRFELVDPENAEIVSLKFFGGLTNQQIAELRGVTERTIQRHWTFAKSCMFEMLQDETR